MFTYNATVLRFMHLINTLKPYLLFTSLKSRAAFNKLILQRIINILGFADQSSSQLLPLPLL